MIIRHLFLICSDIIQRQNPWKSTPCIGSPNEQTQPPPTAEEVTPRPAGTQKYIRVAGVSFFCQGAPVYKLPSAHPLNAGCLQPCSLYTCCSFCGAGWLPMVHKCNRKRGIAYRGVRSKRHIVYMHTACQVCIINLKQPSYANYITRQRVLHV